MNENTNDTEKSFDEFLLSEYNNIASAHFNTISAISSFFRYYLILMAFPLTLYAAVFGLLREGAVSTDLLGVLCAVVSLVIAMVGFFVLIYVISLRFDAILYARTVNAIRKHFYDGSKLDNNIKLRTRVLPQTASIPKYFEGSFFLPVVLSFAAFNSVYLFLFFFLSSVSLTSILGFTRNQIINSISGISVVYWIIVLGFFFFHVFIYSRLAHYREHFYLKSFGMGVDIDGVLNDHKTQFCRLLKEYTGKRLKPEQITSIPVHEIKGIDVTREDEQRVFNDPRYWIEMPCLQGAADNIKKLRNVFKLKIYIFTYRPWPNEENPIGRMVIREWRDIASQELQRLPRRQLLIIRNPRVLRVVGKLMGPLARARMRTRTSVLELRPINIVTKYWLYSNKIQYDELVIERGDEDIADPRGEFRNRFYISRKKQLRFFVEDDYEKATKLAYICDIVFLINQPYNEEKKVPSNVIRVDSWDEIYRRVRVLS